MAKTLTPASDSGAARETSTPTSAKSRVPATRKHRQPLSQRTPSGIASWRQTTESSSAVRVIEANGPPTHEGRGASGASRQTAKLPSSRTSRKRCDTLLTSEGVGVVRVGVGPLHRLGAVVAEEGVGLAA